MNRAQRRRALREAGQRRASSKKGRRPSLRVSQAPYQALAAQGFVVAKSKLHIPETAGAYPSDELVREVRRTR